MSNGLTEDIEEFINLRQDRLFLEVKVNSDKTIALYKNFKCSLPVDLLPVFLSLVNANMEDEIRCTRIFYKRGFADACSILKLKQLEKLTF